METFCSTSIILNVDVHFHLYKTINTDHCNKNKIFQKPTLKYT